jgi:copper chaperone
MTGDQQERSEMSTTATYHVSGMTCGHCVSAVTAELVALEGVVAVNVQLQAGGDSTVTVTSSAPLPAEWVATALDEAGDYHLADKAS